MTIPPLNGTKTHPLSPHAKLVLARLKDGAVLVAQEINPGVINRLFREGCVEYVQRPSPYATHKGKPITHLKYKEPTP